MSSLHDMSWGNLMAGCNSAAGSGVIFRYIYSLSVTGVAADSQPEFPCSGLARCVSKEKIPGTRGGDTDATTNGRGVNVMLWEEHVGGNILGGYLWKSLPHFCPYLLLITLCCVVELKSLCILEMSPFSV